MPSITPSNPAATAAKALAAKFLAEGNYAESIAGGFTPTTGKTPPSTLEREFQPLFDAGFSGLSIAAVGHEEGVDDPRVFIYTAKGRYSGPSEITVSGKSVQIEVNRIGKLNVRPDSSTGATHRGKVFVRKGRVACGSSCAPANESYSGTFGAIVKKQQGGQLFLLSNNHVFAACNHTEVGMHIQSPSPPDTSAASLAPTRIGSHAEICELRSGVPALVSPCKEDLAIALATPTAVSSWQGDDQDGYDTPTAVVAPASGLTVKKFGRTTGLTRGVVEARIPTLTPMAYKMRKFTAIVWFSEIWTVRGESGGEFSLPGDSGSLVVTDDESGSVGIVFGGYNEYALIVPMQRAATQFGGIQLIGGHGV